LQSSPTRRARPGSSTSPPTELHNTKSCPASDDFSSDLSGIGVALLGATGVTVAGNTITGNVPGGPTAVQGGVVVMTGLGGTPPTNNKVVGNLIVGNDPDLFWDSAGSGNTFKGTAARRAARRGSVTDSRSCVGRLLASPRARRLAGVGEPVPLERHALDDHVAVSC
jgi:hypothetical protein